MTNKQLEKMFGSSIYSSELLKHDDNGDESNSVYGIIIYDNQKKNFNVTKLTINQKEFSQDEYDLKGVSAKEAIKYLKKMKKNLI